MKMLTKTAAKTHTHAPLTSASRNAGLSSVHAHVPYRLALIDLQGNIVAVNEDWMALVEETGAEPHRTGPGTNYLEVCSHASLLCPDSLRALDGINGVLKQLTSSFEMDYVCGTPSGRSSFHMDVTSVAFTQPLVVIAHRQNPKPRVSRDKDFTVLKQFAQRLIRTQEEERRRVSLELHDDVGNKVALMALSIRRIMERHKEHPASGDLKNVLHEIHALSDTLRDLSHGLQPPLLLYGGVRPALKSLCEKFQTANGVAMEFRSPDEFPRLSAEQELCIFRIAQESLQNVAKHSGASKVTIVLECEPHQIRMTISDNGRGFIRPDGHEGLGLLSMEARAICVRGRLAVAALPGAGTTVCLSVPLLMAVSEM